MFSHSEIDIPTFQSNKIDLESIKYRPEPIIFAYKKGMVFIRRKLPMGGVDGRIGLINSTKELLDWVFATHTTS